MSQTQKHHSFGLAIFFILRFSLGFDDCSAIVFLILVRLWHWLRTTTCRTCHRLPWVTLVGFSWSRRQWLPLEDLLCHPILPLQERPTPKHPTSGREGIVSRRPGGNPGRKGMVMMLPNVLRRALHNLSFLQYVFSLLWVRTCDPLSMFEIFLSIYGLILFSQECYAWRTHSQSSLGVGQDSIWLAECQNLASSIVPPEAPICPEYLDGMCCLCVRKCIYCMQMIPFQENVHANKYMMQFWLFFGTTLA